MQFHICEISLQIGKGIVEVKERIVCLALFFFSCTSVCEPY